MVSGFAHFLLLQHGQVLPGAEPNERQTSCSKGNEVHTFSLDGEHGAAHEAGGWVWDYPSGGEAKGALPGQLHQVYKWRFQHRVQQKNRGLRRAP